jgi:hypothetical protein
MFHVFSRPVAQEADMKFGSACRVRRVRRVKPKLFFFAAFCGGIPGRTEKNEPKTPDALDVLDVGSDGASISACRDGWRIVRGNVFGRRFSQFRVQGFPDSGHPDFRARGLLSTQPRRSLMPVFSS